MNGMNRHTPHNQHGFTLLEAILAIAIIITGLVALLTLARLSILAADSSANRIRAVAYAQEAMEIIRNIRDTNWLEYDSDSTTPWNDGLYSAIDNTDYSAVLTTTMANPAANHVLDFRPDTHGDTCGGQPCLKLWEDEEHALVMQTAEDAADVEAAGWVTTGYTRLVYLYPICRNNANILDEYIERSEGIPCAGGFSLVGVDVVVSVEYPGRAQRNSYVVEEKMYDWRY